jgi:transposase-like protein
MPSKSRAAAPSPDPFLHELLDAFETGMRRRGESRRYTSEEKEWAIAAIRSGISSTKVANQLRSTPAAVLNWCKAAGVPTGRRRKRPG